MEQQMVKYFFDFVRGTLLSEMQPFPAKNSVLVMDNCSIHHVAQVEDLLESSGIVVIFLPPSALIITL